MIHTFSVTIESRDEDTASTDAFQESLSDAIEDWFYVKDFKVAPITGIQRQHLIGETDND